MAVLVYITKIINEDKGLKTIMIFNKEEALEVGEKIREETGCIFSIFRLPDGQFQIVLFTKNLSFSQRDSLANRLSNKYNASVFPIEETNDEILLEDI